MSGHDTEPPKSFFDALIYYFGAFSMLGLFAVIIYDIGMRYLFNNPPLWSVDIPELIFVWMCFVTVGLATKLGPHIRVTFFSSKMSFAAQRAAFVVMHILVLMMLAAFIVYSVPIIELTADETTLSTGWSGSIYFYALPVGCLIMGYYQIWALVALLRRKR